MPVMRLSPLPDPPPPSWLSRNYRGPLLISDIDETLRDNYQNGVPVRGAVALLQRTAAMRVPIIYLTAAYHSRYNKINRSFLRRHRFPEAPLLDRPNTNRTPNHQFKTNVMLMLRTAVRKKKRTAVIESGTHSPPSCVSETMTPAAFA